MKKVFELHVNGKFTQYLRPSETHLLRWDAEIEFKLIPVKINDKDYKIHFGL